MALPALGIHHCHEAQASLVVHAAQQLLTESASGYVVKMWLWSWMHWPAWI